MVLIICVVVLYRTKDMQKDIDQKNAKIEKLNEQIEEETQRSTSLAEKKAYQSTKRYIEEIARNKLSLYYPDEIIFEEKGKE
jgi:cell division protein FtsB